jgi:hypothetical protein
VQTLVHVYCTRGPSLREKIADDRRLGEFSLVVQKEHQPGRSPGWMKLHSTERGRHGAVNVEWDGATHVLQCRVVTRGGGRPEMILGDLIEYLLSRHRRRIEFVAVVPR